MVQNVECYTSRLEQLCERETSLHAKATTMSREAEEDERNHPNKRLEDSGSLDDNCLGHQILHFLLIFTS